MAEKLKPCPFCGGEAELRSTNYFSVVKCKGCRVEGPVAKISAECCANDEAVKNWNKRHNIVGLSCREDFYDAILYILADDNVKEANQIVELFEDLTADVQPVVHAEWIGFTKSAFLGCDYTGDPIYMDTTVWKCSHCGRNTVVRDNFCPNCGARMDGEQV